MIRAVVKNMLLVGLDRLDDLAASLLKVETRSELRHMATKNGQLATHWLERHADANAARKNAISARDQAFAERDEERTAHQATRFVADKGEAFKAFVHRRLDEMGVPKEFPDGVHTKEGCRIGDRLDWLDALKKARHDEWYIVHCERIDGTPARSEDGHSTFNVVRHRAPPYEHHGDGGYTFEDARRMVKELNGNRNTPLVRVLT